MTTARMPGWLASMTNDSLRPQMMTCWDEVLCETSADRPKCTFNGRGIVCGLERHTQWLVNKHIPRDAVVLELGARFGTVSCAISRRLGYSGQVVSVEPDPEAFRSLSTNVLANDCKGEVVHGAVSRQPLYSMPAAISRRRAGGYATRTMALSNRQCGEGKHCERLSTFTIGQLAERLSDKLGRNVTFDTLVVDCEKCWSTLMQEEASFLRSPGLKRILYELDEKSEAAVRQICSLGFGVVLNEIDCMLPLSKISQLVFERGSARPCIVAQAPGIHCPWKLEDSEHHVASSVAAPTTATEAAAAAAALLPPESFDRSCRCFDMCNRSSVVEWLHRIPEMITDPSSPWMGYLAAVYGSRPQLPFNMTALNFFYHNDESWPINVEWPMANCRIHLREFCREFNGGYCTHANPAPRCSESVCNRWLAPQQQTSRSNLHHIGLMHLRSDDDPLRKTRGTGIFAYPRFEIQKALHGVDTPDGHGMPQILDAFSRALGHGVPRSGEWVEVIRENDKIANHGETHEGREGYGCWYYPARGSGIWIRVGRLIAIHSKDVLSNLLHEWQASASVNHNATASLMSSAHHGEYFPMLAHDLGYDAVFNQFRDLRKTTMARPFAELVITSRSCMWPTVAELAKRKRGRRGQRALGTCVAWVETRHGYAPDRECRCSEERSSLNCGNSSSVEI